MGLTELEPRWFSDGKNNNIAGISFRRPHCRMSRLGVRVDHSAPHIIQVTRDNDITHVPTNAQVWQITGNSPSFDGEVHGGFDHITLSPSVDASQAGHWHRYIQNGEIK